MFSLDYWKCCHTFYYLLHFKSNVFNHKQSIRAKYSDSTTARYFFKGKENFILFRQIFIPLQRIKWQQIFDLCLFSRKFQFAHGYITSFPFGSHIFLCDSAKSKWQRMITNKYIFLCTNSIIWHFNTIEYPKCILAQLQVTYIVLLTWHNTGVTVNRHMYCAK